MHLTDGLLKAYLDGELEESGHAQVSAHLETCSDCHQRCEELVRRSEFTSSRLAALESLHTSSWIQNARQRLEIKRLQKETSWMEKIFARSYRTAWLTLALVLVLALALVFPPVQAVAYNFLGLFRVKQFSVVQINPANLPQQLGQSSQLEAMFANNVRIEKQGEEQPAADAAEASVLAGIPVRLPTRIPGAPQLSVSPAGRLTFTLDLELARAVLQEIGRSDISLPDSLDGAVVEVEVQPSVTAFYGDCQPSAEAAREAGYDPDDPSTPLAADCTTLVQMTSPVVTAPPDLDVNLLGEAFLQVLGMSPEDAAHFASNVDWTTTFVLPIPRYGTSYKDVLIDGVTGTLIRRELPDHPSQFLLLWVKNDIVYALTGPGGESTALRIAGSIE